jgi:polar amino acid transport system permease protein
MSEEGQPVTVDQRAQDERPQPIFWPESLSNVPWWALITLLLGLVMVYQFFTDDRYQEALLFLLPGIRVTVVATLSAFVIAMVLGLITGLGRVSSNVLYYTLSTFYVEVIRGIPMLIIIIYFAYVVTPLGVDLVSSLGGVLQGATLGFLADFGEKLAAVNIRDVDTSVRAILGLAFGYGAFEAEVFRAGIQSIERGQMEAARSLGMSYFQAMRHVILPQAIRRVLPPLGNDFIAMLKDSSLLSVLAVRELTHLGKLQRGRTFRTFEVWNTVAFLYLSMTLTLSMVVKWIERRLSVAD